MSDLGDHKIYILAVLQSSALSIWAQSLHGMQDLSLFWRFKIDERCFRLLLCYLLLLNTIIARKLIWQSCVTWVTTKSQLFSLCQQKTSLEFYIDIHAHSTMMNGFMYGNIFEQEDLFQRQAIFPKLLCRNAEDFSFVSTNSFALVNDVAFSGQR